MRAKLLVGLVVLVAALALSCASARAANRIYWSNDQTGYPISFATLTGGIGGNLNAGANDVIGLAMDPAANRIYFASYYGNEIRYVNLNGTGAGVLTTTGATVNDPDGLTIDLRHRRIYWTNDQAAGPISWAALSGSGGGDLTTTGATMNDPKGLAIDAAQNRIYWSNFDGNTISWAALDGSGGGDLATGTARVDGPMGLTIDTAAGRVYWANGASGDYGISWAALNGSGGGDLATGAATVDDPDGVAVDHSAGRIYWANYDGDSISWAALNGTGGGDVATGAATVYYPDRVALLKVPACASAPRLSGTAKVGHKLSCSKGTWRTDLPEASLFRAPHTYKYQWLRSGKAIAGATARTYKVHAADKGKRLSCRVSAANAAGKTSVTSKALKVT